MDMSLNALINVTARLVAPALVPAAVQRPLLLLRSDELALLRFARREARRDEPGFKCAPSGRLGRGRQRSITREQGRWHDGKDWVAAGSQPSSAPSGSSAL
jgi:hypothetical protein